MEQLYRANMAVARVFTTLMDLSWNSNLPGNTMFRSAGRVTDIVTLGQPPETMRRLMMVTRVQGEVMMLSVKKNLMKHNPVWSMSRFILFEVFVVLKYF